jgi:hypothetical protein
MLILLVSGTKIGEHKYEIWTQTPQGRFYSPYLKGACILIGDIGGIAVKGTVITEQGTIDRSNLGS